MTIFQTCSCFVRSFCLALGARAGPDRIDCRRSVTDSSSAVMPGVLVSLSGERLIGGPQTLTTDASGAYRFDRLSAWRLHVKFELQGFRTDRARRHSRSVRRSSRPSTPSSKSAASTETITVTGESPTVDTRSNMQQTVMNQEILEGVPTGRDPWSLAKLIPGVQVATYDVGGTQSMQQSSMSAHGSNTNDVSYNIDGATVNWPGGGGGATMIYYDQGMFEEVNYMTSAIPAEMLAGGVIDQHGDQGRRQHVAGQRPLQLRQRRPAGRELGRRAAASPDLPRQPDQKTYDFNLSGGGAIVQNRVWVNGTIRKWVVNKLVNATNVDGTQALDDNDLKNYSGKVVAQLTPNQKLIGRLLLERQDPRPSPRQQRPDSGHRVGRADQPGADDAGQVHRHPQPPGVRIELQRHGRRRRTTPTSPTPTRTRSASSTPARTEVFNSPSTREEHQPNSRHQFDNVVHLRQERLGRRAPVQGRRAVGPSVLRVRLLGAGRSLAGLQQRRADRRCASSTRPRSRRTSPRSPASSSRTRGR